VSTEGTQNSDVNKSPSKPRSQEGYSPRNNSEGYRGRGQGAGSEGIDRNRVGAMEVVVSHNIEKALKILKRKLIKEGLFKELKSRRYFEKPSVRKKRKEKEARKKQRKDEARMRKGAGVI
jgi:small subunit ribosomal protein S21